MEKTPLKYLWYYVKIFKYFFLGGFFSIVAAIVFTRTTLRKSIIWFPRSSTIPKSGHRFFILLFWP